MKHDIEALVELKTVRVTWRSEETDDDLVEINNVIYTMTDFEDRVDDGDVGADDVEGETKRIVSLVNEKVVAVDFMVNTAVDRIDEAATKLCDQIDSITAPEGVELDQTTVGQFLEFKMRSGAEVKAH